MRACAFADACRSAAPSAVSVFEIAQVCFGPYTENFSRRSVEKRIDASHRCFSLLMRSVNRSLDFGATTAHPKAHTPPPLLLPCGAPAARLRHAPRPASALCTPPPLRAGRHAISRK
eukprot:6306162-Prymnesium_polylepis.1